LNTKQHLTDNLQESRRSLSRAVRTCPVDRDLSPEWTIRELIIHITGWDLAVVKALQAYLNEHPPYLLENPDIDASNQRMVAAREGQPLDQILDEWQQVRETLLETIARLSDNDLTVFWDFPWEERGTLGEMVAVLAEHERWHAEQIGENSD
jgi:hypothetical protein